MALRQHDERRVREPEVEIGVLLEHGDRRAHILVRHRLELVGPTPDFAEHIQGGCWRDVARDEIVELGEHERRQKSWGRGITKRGGRSDVVRLRCVQGGQEPARVEQDQDSPKPSR